MSNIGQLIVVVADARRPHHGDTVAISRPGVTFNARARGDVTVLAQLSAAAFGTGWPFYVATCQ